MTVSLVQLPTHSDLCFALCYCAFFTSRVQRVSFIADGFCTTGFIIIIKFVKQWH